MRLPNKDDLMLIVAYLLLFVIMTWVFCGCTPDMRSTSHSDHEDDLAQAPFDARRYDPPEWWDECREVLQLVDTNTNQRWWVIRLNGVGDRNCQQYDGWVALPIEPTVDMG